MRAAEVGYFRQAGAEGSGAPEVAKRSECAAFPRFSPPQVARQPNFLMPGGLLQIGADDLPQHQMSSIIGMRAVSAIIGRVERIGPLHHRRPGVNDVGGLVRR